MRHGGDGYDPPEVAGVILTGTVFGHPRKPDGTNVSTSRIVGIDGHRIETESGTVYQLGTPLPAYLDYLRNKGIPFDPENPIRDMRPVPKAARPHQEQSR